MLVAKLDYLQYVAVRSVTNILGAKGKSFWRDRFGSSKAKASSKGESPEKKEDNINAEDKKVEPADGRMPNASGRRPPFAALRYPMTPDGYNTHG